MVRDTELFSFLAPLAGPLAPYIFGAGLFGASMLAAGVLPLATAYTVTEAFGFEHGVSQSFREAPVFLGLYTLLIAVGAAVALWPGLNVISLLVYTQVLNGLLLPIVLVTILRLVNDAEVMGPHVNGRLHNFVGWAVVCFVALLSTLPGIVDMNAASREVSKGPGAGGLHINGGRDTSINFSLDGVQNTDTGSNGGSHNQPNMDAVAEVKVLTSNYQAEYGRNSAGTINVIIKSGTRDFHGSGFWFYRHESLYANNFFSNRSGTPPYSSSGLRSASRSSRHTSPTSPSASRPASNAASLEFALVPATECGTVCRSAKLA